MWVYFPGCIDQRARSYPPVCLDPPPECMSLPLLLLLVWIRCQIFQPFNIDHTSNFSGAVHVFSFRIGLYLWFCFSWLSASWTKQPPNNIRQLTGDEMGNSDGKNQFMVIHITSTKMTPRSDGFTGELGHIVMESIRHVLHKLFRKMEHFSILSLRPT